MILKELTWLLICQIIIINRHNIKWDSIALLVVEDCEFIYNWIGHIDCQYKLQIIFKLFIFNLIYIYIFIYIYNQYIFPSILFHQPLMADRPRLLGKARLNDQIYIYIIYNNNNNILLCLSQQTQSSSIDISRY